MAKEISKPTLCNNQKGFTLIEVMIATGIFAVFIAAYMVAQGFNFSDSSKFSENIKLKNLAEMKMNEIIMDPPELSESLTVGSEEKTFEDEEDYQYKLTWKKFELPDLSKFEEDQNQQDDPVKQLEMKLYEKIKENMEKMLWQLEITIKNKLTGETYTVSSWLYNGEAELTVDSI